MKLDTKFFELLKHKKRLSVFQMIILGFALVIHAGALVLMLPVNVTPGVVLDDKKTLLVLGELKALQKCFKI